MSHDKSVCAVEGGSKHYAARKMFNLLCVVFVTTGRLQKIEGNRWDELLRIEAGGFRSVVFIIHM